MNRFTEEVSKLSPRRLALLCIELQRELDALRRARPEPIAVIGLGCRLPGGIHGPDDLWRVLENGIDAIGPIPADRWDVPAYYDADRTVPGKMYVREGGFLDQVDGFDTEFFGISPTEARQIDPQHRLLLEVSWEALEHAGQSFDRIAGTSTGVFVGIGSCDYLTWQSIRITPESISAYSGTGNAYCFASGRLSYLLGVHGPSIALDTACATSLVTIHLACQSLRAGECTLALAGGVNLMLAPETTIFLSKAQAVAPDGRCKTFDASADGYGRSEGCGMIVLKRLSDAVADGDNVLAVIRGSAINHDGRSSGLTVPNGAAQQAVIRAALAQAGVAPGDVQYVEAHGTGTVLGDPIEIRALTEVLRDESRDADHPLYVGSVKTNIGHTELAAGVAGVMKVVLSLQHETIPPHLHYTQTNPHITFDEIPARVPVTCVPWPSGERPRIAGVSSFGLSGTNAHVVMEGFDPVLDPAAADAASTNAASTNGHRLADAHGHVLTLSARAESSLRALAEAYEQSLAPGGALHEASPRDICYTASVRRGHHRYRWAAVIHSAEDARRKLAALASGKTAGASRYEHKVAFVFAGQGPQWWAMGRDLMAREPVFRAALEACDEVYRRHGGISVVEEIQRDEEHSRLAETEVAQPALFALQMALTRLLASWGVKPDSVIGHSLGEVAAAWASGSLTLEDAAYLALHRGRIMQKATGHGRMAAVALSAAEAASVAARYDGRLAVATINSPSSCVLSGDIEPLQRALAELDARNVWHHQLPVNYAFHSHQMIAFAPELREALASLRPQVSAVPMISTVTGREIEGDALGAGYWAKNLTDPVQFAAGIQDLIASGHDVFVEIAPHPVLRKSVSECLDAAGRRATVLGSLRRGADERGPLLETIAELYAIGLGVEWGALHRDAGRVVTLPRYPWNRRRYWVEIDHEPHYARGGANGTKAARDAASAILDVVHELRWEETERKAPVKAALEESGAWLIFADRGGTGAALARTMRACGQPCEVVYAAAGAGADEDASAVSDMPRGAEPLDPTSLPAFRDLLKARQARTSFRGIVYLWGLDADVAADASPRMAYGGLLHVIQAAVQTGWRASQFWVVTRGSQPAAGSTVTREALAQAPLWGMARTVPLELPSVSCIAVDLDPDEDAGAIDGLLNELDHWDGVDQVALRGTTRYLPRIHRRHPESEAGGSTRDAASLLTPPALRADATYLITGGTGGIGLEVTRWMVRHGARHLVLMARSAPSAELLATLGELQNDETTVTVLRGDVAKREDVARVLAEIDATPWPLRGVIHGAGIVEFGFVERQPWESFAAVYPAKLQGAWNLHTLTEDRPLDLFVLFSSTAAIFGSLGQANYSGANAFLDALAHYRRAAGLPAQAINWGPWAEVGMASKQGAQVRERWASQGVVMMTSAEAIGAFAHVMALDTAQIMAINIDWPTFIRVYPQIERIAIFDVMAAGPGRGKGGDSQDDAALRQQLAGASPDEARVLVEDYVRGQVAQALGFDASHPLDVNREFFEMGLDSLLATRIMLRLNDAFQVNLPVSVMFERPTIAALAEEVVNVRASLAEPVPVADATAPSPAVSGAFDARTFEPASEIPRREDPSFAPLSFAQRGLWFLEQWAPGNRYNIPMAARFSGAVDADALGRAIALVVARHESLRTTFVEDSAGPRQGIAPDVTIPLRVVDLSFVPAAVRETVLRRLMLRDVRQPFDLARGPLMRTTLWRLTPVEHVFSTTVHHITADAGSLDIFVHELTDVYAALLTRRPMPLPPLAIQYGDYAAWEHARLEGFAAERSLAYWETQLAGVVPLELPADRPRSAVRTFASGAEPWTLTPELSASVRDLARRERVTMFTLLLAAYAALLRRYTHQDDVAIGSPMTTRLTSELEPLIGLFINTLVFRMDAAGHQTFPQFLGHTRDVLLGAFAHRDVPFEQIVERLQPVRRDDAPLFNVMLVLIPPMDAEVGPPEFRMKRMFFAEEARYDLTLLGVEEGETVNGLVSYSAELFDASTVARMAGHFACLLQGIVEQPAATLETLPLLTEQERAQLVLHGPLSAAASRAPGNVLERFEYFADATPDAIAVQRDGEMLTYQDVDRRANQIAHTLIALGVSRGARVALCLDRRPPLILTLLGIMKAGACYVPLDPGNPVKRLHGIVEDARPSVLVTEARYAALWRHADDLTVLDLDADAEMVSSRPASRPELPVSSDDAVYVIYTSGSTGRPKGVVVPHGALMNSCRGVIDSTGIDRGDRFLHFAPIGFDVSAFQIFPALITGAVVILAPPANELSNDDILNLCEDSFLTILDLPSAVWQQWMTDMAERRVTLPAGLRSFMTGGESTPMESMRAWASMVAGSARFVSSYGPTETAVTTMWRGTAAEVSGWRMPSVALGRPLTDVRLAVLDRALQPVPLGVSGELCVSGIGLAHGYIGRSDLTADRFVPDPYSDDPGARLYRTGDRVRYRADGVLEFLGRFDHQLKLHGVRIESGEIEALLRRHPQVRAAVVVALPKAGVRRPLVAYVVPADLAPTDADLREHLAAHLPSTVLPNVFCFLDALPISANGKIDRRALPVPDLVDEERTIAEPATHTEHLLSEMWSETLTLPQVSVDDDFFALGGNSLAATRLASRLRDAFDVDLPVRAVFEAPTIATLARYIDERRRERRGDELPALMTVERGGPLPVSFAQQSLWLLEQFEPANSIYVNTEVVRFRGPFVVDAFAQSLTAIVARHEVLRTTFQTVDGEPRQVIGEPWALDLPLTDLASLPPDEREMRAEELAKAEAARPCDLSTGPLLRVSILRMGAGDHIVLFTMHHIVFDLWSMDVLLSELGAGYRVALAGRTAHLPDLPIQYADYAAWERRRWSDGALDRAIERRRAQIGGTVEDLNLPTDRPRGLTPRFVGGSHELLLPAGLLERLQQTGRRAGVTLFMSLLAGLETLLHLYTGQESILVAVPVANRDAPGTDRLIGFFINHVVVVSRFDGNPTCREILGRIRTATLDAFDHQDLPFEEFVRRLRPERQGSHAPLHRVLFNLLNLPDTLFDLPGIQAELPLRTARDTTKYDLRWGFIESEGRMTGLLEYDRELFDPPMIERMAADYVRLLEAFVETPERAVESLNLMTRTQETLALSFNEPI